MNESLRACRQSDSRAERYPLERFSQFRAAKKRAPSQHIDTKQKGRIAPALS